MPDPQKSEPAFSRIDFSPASMKSEVCSPLLCSFKRGWLVGRLVGLYLLQGTSATASRPSPEFVRSFVRSFNDSPPPGLGMRDR